SKRLARQFPRQLSFGRERHPRIVHGPPSFRAAISSATMGGERHIRVLPLITFSRPGDRKRKGDRRVGVSDQEFKHVFHSARGTARFPRNSIFHAMRRYARR